MEIGLINYIKNMFSMETTPVWNSSYEGVIFYDKNSRKWVSGNNEGFQVLDRSSTMVSGIAPIDWIDPFEYPTDEILRNNYTVTDLGEQPAATLTKSVILDITDNWGGASAVMCREVDFYFEGIKLPLIPSDYIVYGQAHSTPYEVANLFDTDTSLIDAHIDNGWQQNTSSSTRVIIVFNTSQLFDSIIVNNHHTTGTATEWGIQNVKITITPDIESNTTYDAVITNGVLIFDGVFDRHSSVNEVDAQTLVLQNLVAVSTLDIYVDNTNTTYGDYSLKGIATLSGSIGSSITKTMLPEINTIDKEILAFDIKSSRVGTNLELQLLKETEASTSIVIDIANDWGGAETYMSIRSVEFLDSEGAVIPLTTNFTAYSTSVYPGYAASMAFNTDLLKVGSWSTNAWISVQGSQTNQRLICVFDNPRTVYGIIINNGHHLGGYVTQGVKDIKIYASTDTITSTIYDEIITNSILAYDGQIDQHVPSDVVDDQPLEITSHALERYNIDIPQANTFVSKELDITTSSGVFNKLKLEILNDDLDNTFYIDNMRFKAPEPIHWIDPIEYPTNDIIRNNYISTTPGTESLTTKSIIFDITNNWGDGDFMGVRVIEFLFEGSVISNIPTTNFISYATSNLTDSYHHEHAFDTSQPKDGGAADNDWLSTNGQTTNQRLICVFNTPTTFDSIVINNSTSSANRGIKDFKITMSDDAITSTIYDAVIANSVVIFEGQIDTHEVSVPSDDQILFIPLLGPTPLQVYSENSINTYGNYSLKAIAEISASQNEQLGKILSPVVDTSTITNIKFDVRSSRVGTNIQVQLKNETTYTAKSVIIDITDNWGLNTLNLRAMDFFLDDVLIPITISDITSYETTKYDAQYPASNVFVTSLSRIGTHVSTSWNGSADAVTFQRLICVFNSPITFNKIEMINCHVSGANTGSGLKNTIVTISDDTITSTVYGAGITNSTVLFDGVIDEHSLIDEADEQVIIDSYDVGTTHNINIQNINTFQTETWDLTTASGIYDTLTFTVLNDDLENTFYIDNIIKV